MMGLKMKMYCLKLALVSTIIVSVFPLMARPQTTIGSCSFQGLHLDKCLNQQGEYVFLEPCCRALNQALRVGIHCLCSMFNTDNAPPQLTALFSLSLSSCYIMVPPLTVCRDLGTMPISLPLPPNSSTNKEVRTRTAQQTPQVGAPPLLPPTIPQAPISPPHSGSPTVVEQQPQPQPRPSKNVTSMLHVVEHGNNNESSSGSRVIAVFCCFLSSLSLTVYFIF